MTRPSHSQGGVALLEVLISLLIFSFGVLGLIGLQARAISMSVDAEDRNRAALLANELATAMWLSKSVTIDTSAGSAWDTRIKDPTKDGLPSATVAITAVSGIPNSVDITISWTPPQRAATTSTVVASSQLTTRVTLPPP